MNIVFTASELINGFRNGDEPAIRHLYDLHYRPLCYFAEKLVKDKTEAEDIAVDTFLKLLNKKNDFYNLPDIKAFLFTATRNACFDYMRKTKRHHKSNLELKCVSDHDEPFGEREMLTAIVAAEMGISTQTVLNQKAKALQTLRLMLYKEYINSALLFLCFCFLSPCYCHFITVADEHSKALSALGG